MSNVEETETEEVAALKARIAAARAKRHEIARRREEREAAEALVAQAEAEELAARNESAIESAAAEHGPLGKRIAAVDTPLGVVIVKRPNHLTFRKFMDTGQAKTKDLERLVRPCLVHPDVSAFERMLEELPALIAPVADAVAELAGVRDKEVSGK